MSDEIRRIVEPPEIRWAGNRSLLLTLRLVLHRLRTDPDQAYDLPVLAYGDARDIIEDADLVIQAVRGDSPGLWHLINELAQSIEGELEADDAAAAEEAPEGDE